jgi:hypothetical protein
MYERSRAGARPLPHDDRAGDDRALPYDRSGIHPDGTGKPGGGMYAGTFVDDDIGLKTPISIKGGLGGVEDGLSNRGKVVARAVDERGGALEAMAADLQTGGDDLGQKLFFKVLVSGGLNESEGGGFHHVNAGGFEQVDIIGAAPRANGDRGASSGDRAATAVFFDHGVEIEIVGARSLDGEEGVASEPVGEIAKAAGGAAREEVFGIVDAGGVARFVEFGSNEAGFAIRTDGDLVAAGAPEEREYVGDEGFAGKGPEGSREAGPGDFQTGSHTTGKNDSFHERTPTE